MCSIPVDLADLTKSALTIDWIKELVPIPSKLMIGHFRARICSDFAIT